jgi:hypothetical protein
MVPLLLAHNESLSIFEIIGFSIYLDQCWDYREDSYTIFNITGLWIAHLVILYGLLTSKRAKIFNCESLIKSEKVL